MIYFGCSIFKSFIELDSKLFRLTACPVLCKAPCALTALYSDKDSNTQCSFSEDDFEKPNFILDFKISPMFVFHSPKLWFRHWTDLLRNIAWSIRKIEDLSKHSVEASFTEWCVGSLSTQPDKKHINRPIHHFKITALWTTLSIGWDFSYKNWEKDLFLLGSVGVCVPLDKEWPLLYNRKLYVLHGWIKVYFWSIVLYNLVMNQVLFLFYKVNHLC